MVARPAPSPDLPTDPPRDLPTNRSLDLNADLGEGWGAWSMGDDEAMLDVVTTANIACGGHAGDPSTMRRAVRGAHERGVAITAHVAYPDLQGFGRRFVDIAPAELTDQVIAQTGSLLAIAGAVGAQVVGVKPHGALYSAIAHHEAQAEAVVTALRELSGLSSLSGLDETGGALQLVAAPGSVVAQKAEAAGLEVVLEGFADRAYRADGTLVPRREPGAVLLDPEAVAAQAIELALRGRARVHGSTSWVDVPCRSICLHGDTPGAVALAREVRARLEGAGVALAAPGSSGRSGRSGVRR
ncbi:LamB/YcsF family protein [Brachybacterium sp. DNPG3]